MRVTMTQYIEVVKIMDFVTKTWNRSIMYLILNCFVYLVRSTLSIALWYEPDLQEPNRFVGKRPKEFLGCSHWTVSLYSDRNTDNGFFLQQFNRQALNHCCKITIITFLFGLVHGLINCTYLLIICQAHNHFHRNCCYINISMNQFNGLDWSLMVKHLDYEDTQLLVILFH